MKIFFSCLTFTVMLSASVYAEAAQSTSLHPIHGAPVLPHVKLESCYDPGTRTTMSVAAGYAWFSTHQTSCPPPDIAVQFTGTGKAILGGFLSGGKLSYGLRCCKPVLSY